MHSTAPVAMPRASWREHEHEHALSSPHLLVGPSQSLSKRLCKAFEQRDSNNFDMEIVNKLHGDSCCIIPHRVTIYSSVNSRPGSTTGTLAPSRKSGIRIQSSRRHLSTSPIGRCLSRGSMLRAASAPRTLLVIGIAAIGEVALDMQELQRTAAKGLGERIRALKVHGERHEAVAGFARRANIFMRHVISRL